MPGTYVQKVHVQTIGQLVICHVSVNLTEGGPVGWERDFPVVHRTRLTSRWGKPTLRRLKRLESVTDALLNGHSLELRRVADREFTPDEVIDFFDRLMPNYAISFQFNWLVGLADVVQWATYLPKPEGPRIAQR